MNLKKNNNLHNAKKNKKDEFYTLLSDIEKELKHYKNFFKGKIVYCNCDDPILSNFTKYFILNFHFLGLKKLVSTFYDVNNERKAYVFQYEGQDINNDGRLDNDDIQLIAKNKLFHTYLNDDEGFDYDNKDKCWENGIYGNGDFRSKECIEFLKEADVVVTNPPFSLFREYVAQLMEYDKKFLILGNMNSITYKEIFPYIKNDELWWGVSLNGTKCSFIVPQNYEGSNVYEENGVRYGKVNNAIWFTNITHPRRTEELDLYKKYSNDYLKYDNYNAIEVSKVADIPIDYDGIMGVPITFLYKYCPTQFEILGLDRYVEDNPNYGHRFTINGKETYARILIRKK